MTVWRQSRSGVPAISGLPLIGEALLENLFSGRAVEKTSRASFYVLRALKKCRNGLRETQSFADKKRIFYLILFSNKKVTFYLRGAALSVALFGGKAAKKTSHMIFYALRAIKSSHFSNIYFLKKISMKTVSSKNLSVKF